MVPRSVALIEKSNLFFGDLLSRTCEVGVILLLGGFMRYRDFMFMLIRLVGVCVMRDYSNSVIFIVHLRIDDYLVPVERD